MSTCLLFGEPIPGTLRSGQVELLRIKLALQFPCTAVGTIRVQFGMFSEHFDTPSRDHFQCNVEVCDKHSVWWHTMVPCASCCVPCAVFSDRTTPVCWLVEVREGQDCSLCFVVETCNNSQRWHWRIYIIYTSFANAGMFVSTPIFSVLLFPPYFL